MGWAFVCATSTSGLFGALMRDANGESGRYMAPVNIDAWIRKIVHLDLE